MTPEAFIAKWKASELKERSASQSHFNDLCALLDEPTPVDADPKGDWYCFERGASKTAGGDGWADVWKRHHFGWEYKGKRKNLDAAFSQLQQYAVALENPPLLVVCDMERFRIHTNWTNTVSEVHDLALDDLIDAEKRQLLKWTLSEPSQLKPRLTRDALTEQVASEFATLALKLRQRGHEPHTVAHFINRLVFCMFAEDVNLLPNNLFTQMLESTLYHPDEFQPNAQQLFAGMRSGGVVAFKKIEWFNGGLFDTDEALPLTRGDIELVLRAARMNWSDIDPTIFGTLFERGLDPNKRSQLGAHYTDRDKIMKIIEPVVLYPLEHEWQKTRSAIEAQVKKAAEARARRPQTSSEARKVYRIARQAEERAYRAALKARDSFIERLRSFRVLDPACGSGNFLYLSLHVLKDLEHRALLDAEALGVERSAPSVGPEAVKGIEINPYAAELARVTVWIGEIQWMKRNGFDVSRNPILKPLDNIECRDALLNDDGSCATWPHSDVVVGNPPFAGKTKLLSNLGKEYVHQLRAAYAGRVAAGADLVCYWFDRSLSMIVAGTTNGVGLVATQSIRSGVSRGVLDRIRDKATIYHAWSDEAWVLDGAAVRVSLICFARDNALASSIRLNGQKVKEIYSDLSARSVGDQSLDMTQAHRLPQNEGRSFHGVEKAGNFDVPGDLAREWLQLPANPNGKHNNAVLRPLVNGAAITRRYEDMWIIDFSDLADEVEASLYEAPFQYVLEHVRPQRLKNNRESKRRYWWRHGEVQPAMRSAVKGLDRFIATPRVAKHRLFRWMAHPSLPDTRLHVIALEHDIWFGVLHSRFHEIWSLATCSWHGVGNDPTYNGLCFETFPFPDNLSPALSNPDQQFNQQQIAIGEAAHRLNELRESWLNPPDLVRREPEVVAGFPERIIPVDSKAAAVLKNRTLTNLYNDRPAWLDSVHRELDEAVAAAYGWPDSVADDEILRRLFNLNQERSAVQSTA